MVPIVYPLTFDEGVNGSADFTVSNDLPVTQAQLTVFKNRDFNVAEPLVIPCAVVGNTIQVRISGTDTDALSAGRHMYQLDAVNGGAQVRIARGEVTIVPGKRSVFT